MLVKALPKFIKPTAAAIGANSGNRMRRYV